MSEFINVTIDRQKCIGTGECGRCLGVCPVSIFTTQDPIPAVNERNEDECTLCDLCLKACRPDAINIRKLYE